MKNRLIIFNRLSRTFLIGLTCLLTSALYAQSVSLHGVDGTLGDSTVAETKITTNFVAYHGEILTLEGSVTSNDSTSWTFSATEGNVTFSPVSIVANGAEQPYTVAVTPPNGFKADSLAMTTLYEIKLTYTYPNPDTDVDGILKKYAKFTFTVDWLPNPTCPTVVLGDNHHVTATPLASLIANANSKGEGTWTFASDPNQGLTLGSSVTTDGTTTVPVTLLYQKSIGEVKEDRLHTYPITATFNANTRSYVQPNAKTFTIASSVKMTWRNQAPVFGWVDITGDNDAPFLDGPPELTFDENRELFQKVFVYDLDQGDKDYLELTFTSNDSIGANWITSSFIDEYKKVIVEAGKESTTFTGRLYTITYAPKYVNGRVPVTFNLKDKASTVSNIQNVTILNVNHPPQFFSTNVEGFVQTISSDDSSQTQPFKIAEISLAYLDDTMPTSLTATVSIDPEKGLTFVSDSQDVGSSYTFSAAKGNGTHAELLNAFKAKLHALQVKPTGDIEMATTFVLDVVVRDSLEQTSTLKYSLPDLTVTVVYPKRPPVIELTGVKLTLTEGKDCNPFIISDITHSEVTMFQVTVEGTLITIEDTLISEEDTLISEEESRKFYSLTFREDDGNTFTGNAFAIKDWSEGILVTALENQKFDDKKIELTITVKKVKGGIVSCTNIAIKTVDISLKSRITLPTVTGIRSDATVYVNTGKTVDPIFPASIIVRDPDWGGTQQVRLVSIVTEPAGYGTFKDANDILDTTFMTPAALTETLKLASFTADGDSKIPLGTTMSVKAVITVQDEKGEEGVNSNLTIHITAVDQPPNFAGVPSIQPVLLPLAGDGKPFDGISVSDDTFQPSPSTNKADLTVTITLDNNDKGTLSSSPTSGFEFKNNVYKMTGHKCAISAALRALVYTLNLDYTFPLNDPGGTIFTLEAEDAKGNISTATVTVQVQDPPRNWLVTKSSVGDRMTRGTLGYAIANLNNHDVITFALPEYPEIIVLTETIVLDKIVTIKGPGADLLTLSGGANTETGRQLFAIYNNVTFEGLSFVNGNASMNASIADRGGAIAVTGADGALTLRDCSVRTSLAKRGGAVYVGDGASLNVERSSFVGNSTGANGVMGGAIALDNAEAATITNSSFINNAQQGSSFLGGGAIWAGTGNDYGYWIMPIAVKQCTFIGNDDQSTMRGNGNGACSLYASGVAVVTVQNSVFADSSRDRPKARCLNVMAGGRILSEGGNLCTDSTRTSISPNGDLTSKFVLSKETNDEVSVSVPILNAPIDATTYYSELSDGSPAKGKGVGSDGVMDQRGFLNTTNTANTIDSGAIQMNATSRLIISEIQLTLPPPSPKRFVELMVPADSLSFNTTGYALYLNDIEVAGLGDHLIASGCGIIVWFDTSFSTLTEPGVTQIDASAFKTDYWLLLDATRGTFTVKRVGKDPIVTTSYLLDFKDPTDGTDYTNRTDFSIATAPAGIGFAFVPHDKIDTKVGLFGVNMSQTGGTTQSPGLLMKIPFSKENIAPTANPDAFNVDEDTEITLDLLANDVEPNIGDALRIVSLVLLDGTTTMTTTTTTTTTNGATVTISADGKSVIYNPQNASEIQALSSGEILLDSFDYTIQDFASQRTIATVGTPSGTIITAPAHGLSINDMITLIDADDSLMALEWMVTTVDDNRFTIAHTYDSSLSYGTWIATNPRVHASPSSSATVTLTVTGINDAPVAMDDDYSGSNESCLENESRMIKARVAKLDEGDFLSGNGFLMNDTDADKGESYSNFKIIALLPNVQSVTSFSGEAGVRTLTIASDNHGLTTGDSVIIANYPAVPTYTGTYQVTVIDDKTFTVPSLYIVPHNGDLSVGGSDAIWSKYIPDAQKTVITEKGATVTLYTFSDLSKDYVMYNPSQSQELRKLPQGGSGADSFYYVIEDQPAALGAAKITLTVRGVNQNPTVTNAPEALYKEVETLITEETSFADLMKDRIQAMDCIAVGDDGKAEILFKQKQGDPPTFFNAFRVKDIFYTTEDQPVTLLEADLLSGDTDIDENDTLAVSLPTLNIISVKGATISKVDGNLRYDPTTSAELQTLAAEMFAIDTFEMNVVDRHGGSTVKAVAVVVEGKNSKPTIAKATFGATTPYDSTKAVTVEPLPFVTPVDTGDIVKLLPQTAITNTANANVSTTTDTLTSEPLPSGTADNVYSDATYVNEMDVQVINDTSLIANRDTFNVWAGTTNEILPILINDYDTTEAGELTIVDVTSCINGCTVAITGDKKAVTVSVPDSATGYDSFIYTVQNAYGIRSRAKVTLNLYKMGVSGALYVADDTFAVVIGNTITMDVTYNDRQIPNNAGMRVVDVQGDHGLSIGNGLSIENNQVVFDSSKAATSQKVVRLTYDAMSGSGELKSAKITVKIVGSTSIACDDAFTVLADSFNTHLDVLGNDRLLVDTGATPPDFDRSLIITNVNTKDVGGTVTISEDKKSLIYSVTNVKDPTSRYIGREYFTYTTLDYRGLVGEANVLITVGNLTANNDLIAVNSAPDTSYTYDVLANDTTLPDQLGSITITKVEKKISVEVWGTAESDVNISDSGKELTFTSAAIGNTYRYTISESVPLMTILPSHVVRRTATAQVQVIELSAGALSVNPDRYNVWRNGSRYALPVCANDRTTREELSLAIIATSAIATHQGGSIEVGSIDNTPMIYYTPKEGYIGTDFFTYTVSDGRDPNGKIARVDLNVMNGKAYVNNDHFKVYQEWGRDGMKAFDLPVSLNDVILPSDNRTLAVVDVGQPERIDGTVEAAGTVSLVDGTVRYVPAYDPVNDDYQIKLTYDVKVDDDTATPKQASVIVDVLRREKALDVEIQDDVFYVAANSRNNVLPVLENDIARPGTNDFLTITSAQESTQYRPLTLSRDRRTLLYTPEIDFVGRDECEAYYVSDGQGATGSAKITIHVGNIRTLPDQFTVRVNSSDNELDVLANDTADISKLIIEDSPLDTFTINADKNRILYTPPQGTKGRVTFAYTVIGATQPATVTVDIVDPNEYRYAQNVEIHYQGVKPAPNNTAFSAWGAQNGFALADLTDENFATDDTDGDGATNLEEYIFGGNPTMNNEDDGIKLEFDIDSTHSILTCRQRTNDTTLSFVIQGRTTLNDAWESLTTSDLQIQTLTTDASYGVVQYKLPITHTARFFRIRVTQK